jgi:hypothetical protein
MILSRRVALGGVQLDEIHEAIVIRSIDPGVPNETINAVERMGGAGQRITGQHWNTLDVQVTYAIDVPKDQLELRRQIFEAVNAWALRKGWLTVNYMTNRRVYVDKAVLPGSKDLWEWTSDYTITFRAYNVPFWQDELPGQAVSGIAQSGTVAIAVGGNTESVLDATFANKSGMTIQNFRITANGNTIQLTGISLGGNASLAISHGTDGLLRIMKGNTSIYSKYTGADDLYVNPGNTAVTYAADRAGVLTVQNYGRYI